MLICGVDHNYCIASIIVTFRDNYLLDHRNDHRHNYTINQRGITAMAKHNRFKQGSSTFKCHACGKETRDTGHNEAQLELCKKCLFRAYMENAESDYGDDSDEYAQAKANYEALK